MLLSSNLKTIYDVSATLNPCERRTPESTKDFPI